MVLAYQFWGVQDLFSGKNMPCHGIFYSRTTAADSHPKPHTNPVRGTRYYLIIKSMYTSQSIIYQIFCSFFNKTVTFTYKYLLG